MFAILNSNVAFIVNLSRQKLARNIIKKIGSLWLLKTSDFYFVIRLGFEPKTHSLEGCCSIQLSYRTDPYYFRASAGLIPKVGANIGLFV